MADQQFLASFGVDIDESGVSRLQKILAENRTLADSLSADATTPRPSAPNIDGFLFLPVAAGMWKQHELWDGTYTLDDLLDAAELIQVRRENEERAAEAARS